MRTRRKLATTEDTEDTEEILWIDSCRFRHPYTARVGDALDSGFECYPKRNHNRHRQQP